MLSRAQSVSDITAEELRVRDLRQIQTNRRHQCGKVKLGTVPRAHNLSSYLLWGFGDYEERRDGRNKSS